MHSLLLPCVYNLLSAHFLCSLVRCLIVWLSAFLYLGVNFLWLQILAPDRLSPSLCSHFPHPPHLHNQNPALSKCFTLWLKMLQVMFVILTAFLSTGAQDNHEQSCGLLRIAYHPSSSLKAGPALTEIDDLFF